MQKPLIAAVNGAAIGVGTTMLMHCDLIVAARSARFVMPFTSLGLVPEAASSLLFPRLLGHQRASALLLLGEPLDAATAHEWGFVNRVVEDAALMETAHEIAQRLASLPPQAVRLTKRLIRHGEGDVAGRMDGGAGAVPRTPRFARGSRGVQRLHGAAKTSGPVRRLIEARGRRSAQRIPDEPDPLVKREIALSPAIGRRDEVPSTQRRQGIEPGWRSVTAIPVSANATIARAHMPGMRHDVDRRISSARQDGGAEVGVLPGVA